MYIELKFPLSQASRDAGSASSRTKLGHSRSSSTNMQSPMNVEVTREPNAGDRSVPGIPVRLLPRKRSSPRESLSLRAQTLKDITEESLSGLDPALSDCSSAWKCLTRTVSLETLRYSHDVISATFSNGMHSGELVRDLTGKLLRQECCALDLPPLVVIESEGQSCLFVICGNRRFWALKEFAAQSRSDPFIRVIVHSFPEFTTVRNRRMRAALKLKACLAMTTTSSGESVTISRHVGTDRP